MEIKLVSHTDWLSDFLSSEEIQKLASIEAVADFAEDVISSVKEKKFATVDDALADLRYRTGLSVKEASIVHSAVMQKTAEDKEWHKITNSQTGHIMHRANQQLKELADAFDQAGMTKLANIVDETLKDL